MLEVKKTADGLFEVTVTLMHYEWLDNCSKNTGVSSEGILALCVGIGLCNISDLCIPLDAASPPPVRAIDDADDETF